MFCMQQAEARSCVLSNIQAEISSRETELCTCPESLFQLFKGWTYSQTVSISILLSEMWHETPHPSTS
jgi:hypothetical protein